MFRTDAFLSRATFTALAAVLTALLMTAPIHAQDRDFLTTDEVEQVRETQEPNARLMLYNKFAESRLLQVEELLKKEKAGRSILIHDLLEDLVEILDTIDIVADDALMNNMDIAAGMEDVLKKHQVIAASLKKIDEMDLSDRGRYSFQLQMAIDTVEDAIELAQEDLSKRKTDVVAKDRAEKAELEALKTPTQVAEEKAEEKKQAEFDKKTGRSRKAPTLYKPGEKPGDPVGGPPPK